MSKAQKHALLAIATTVAAEYQHHRRVSAMYKRLGL